jgi:hypothetical protein
LIVDSIKIYDGEKAYGRFLEILEKIKLNFWQAAAARMASKVRDLHETLHPFPNIEDLRYPRPDSEP